MDARLDGPTVLLKDLIDLAEGDVLSFDYPIHKPVDCTLNGRIKFHGHIAANGWKKAFGIDFVHSRQKI